MSEIIFEIITRSITLKAKQEEGKALLSCTKSKIKEKKEKNKNKNFLYISGFGWIMEEFGKEFLCYCSYWCSRC